MIFVFIAHLFLYTRINNMVLLLIMNLTIA